MKYIIYDNDPLYRKWLFDPETDDTTSSLDTYSASFCSLFKDDGRFTGYALEFPKEEYLLLFTLRYQ